MALVVSIAALLILVSYFWPGGPPLGGTPTQETLTTDDNIPQPPTPTPTDLPTAITDEKGVPMVLVPAGPFEMGSESGAANERPAHKVILDAFYIDQYEVTNALYVACVSENSCDPPNNNHYVNSKYSDHP